MARYSRRRGPPSDMVLSQTPEIIPGTSWQRFLDDGELLILFRSRIIHDSGPAAFVSFVFRVDGSVFFDAAVGVVAGNNTTTTYTDYTFVRVAAGIHTFEVAAFLDSGATAHIPQQTTLVTFIQFPLWDSDADIQ